MDFIKHYLRDHKRTIYVFFICSMLFIVTFALYHLPMAAVCYPIVLSMGVIVISVFIDIRKQKIIHEKLEWLQNLPDNLSELLTSFQGQKDEAYREIITLLEQRQKDILENESVRMLDRLNYFTLWVHQIKTPIASMRLTLEAEDSERSRKIAEDLFRIEQYVDMVLTYLRLDATETDYVIKEYDLDKVIKSSIRKFASQFITKGIKLDYSTVDYKVVTDEKWFSFVLEQLLSNSLKYTKKGSIQIYMEEENLHIKDTGIGIAPEDLPRIFEKGYTGYNGRVDKKASGIGLYLCKSICDNLGLTIRAESVVGQGTTIIIGLQQKKDVLE